MNGDTCTWFSSSWPCMHVSVTDRDRRTGRRVGVVGQVGPRTDGPRRRANPGAQPPHGRPAGACVPVGAAHLATAWRHETRQGELRVGSEGGGLGPAMWAHGASGLVLFQLRTHTHTRRRIDGTTRARALLHSPFCAAAARHESSRDSLSAALPLAPETTCSPSQSKLAAPSLSAARSKGWSSSEGIAVCCRCCC